MSDGDGSKAEQKLREILARLEEERDELKVKAGLAKLEAREEWEELNEKIQRLRGRLRVLKDEAKDASEDVGEAFELLADEVKEGIGRLKKLL